MLTIVRKHQPVFRLSDGKLYVKVAERDAKRREDSQRVFDKREVVTKRDDGTEVKERKVELLWFVPLDDSQQMLPMFGVTGQAQQA